MALVKCVKCGHELADLPTACPKCGETYVVRASQENLETMKKELLGWKILTFSFLVVFVVFVVSAIWFNNYQTRLWTKSNHDTLMLGWNNACQSGIANLQTCRDALLRARVENTHWYNLGYDEAGYDFAVKVLDQIIQIEKDNAKKNGWDLGRYK